MVDPNNPSVPATQPPEWGSVAILSLFQSVSDFQLEVRIFDVWKTGRTDDKSRVSGRFMPPIDSHQISRDTFSELPLAVTKQRLEHGDSAEDYLVGLIKLNPITGEMIKGTWAYAMEIESGSINDKHSPYNADQLAFIHWQLQAQEILGIQLDPSGET